MDKLNKITVVEFPSPLLGEKGMLVCSIPGIDGDSRQEVRLTREGLVWTGFSERDRLVPLVCGRREVFGDKEYIIEVIPATNIAIVNRLAEMAEEMAEKTANGGKPAKKLVGQLLDMFERLMAPGAPGHKALAKAHGIMARGELRSGDAADWVRCALITRASMAEIVASYSYPGLGNRLTLLDKKLAGSQQAIQILSGAEYYDRIQDVPEGTIPPGAWWDRESAMDSPVDHVVIHGGKAHADDFLAVAFAIGLEIIGEDTPVYRRDPTPGELQSPTVLVLDVGGQFSPELNNYDHHQLSEEELSDTVADCAMTLFLESKAPEVHDALSSYTKWYWGTAALDARGPFNTARFLGVAPDAVFALNSGIATPILGAMGAMARIEPWLMRLAAVVGRDHVEFAREANNVAAEIRDIAHHTDVAGVPVMVVGAMPDTPSAMTALRRVAGERSAQIAVFPDNRGDGWSIMRLGEASIDLAGLADNPAVKFAHKGGFIAKTGQMPVEQAVDLLRRHLGGEVLPEG